MKVQVKGLKQVQVKLANMQKFSRLDMKEIAFRGHADVMQHFSDQKGPSKPWKKTSRPGRILQDQGTLRSSIRPSYGKRFAIVKTNLKYAGVHNFGKRMKAREVRPKNGEALKWTVGGKTFFSKGHKIPAYKMPKREFMYLSRSARKKIKERMAEMAVKGF